jgi:hypothetical protein
VRATFALVLPLQVRWDAVDAHAVSLTTPSPPLPLNTPLPPAAGEVVPAEHARSLRKAVKAITFIDLPGNAKYWRSWYVPTLPLATTRPWQPPALDNHPQLPPLATIRESYAHALLIPVGPYLFTLVQVQWVGWASAYASNGGRISCMPRRYSARFDRNPSGCY